MMICSRLRAALRGFRSVNATFNPDHITAIALSVKPGEMTAAEAELRAIEEQRTAVLAEMRDKHEIANPAFASPLKFITKDARDAAQARIAELNKESGRLNTAATSIRQKIASLEPANASAVNAALAPLRKEAAGRVVSAVEELITASAVLDAAGAVLQAAGTRPTRIPKLPLEAVLSTARAIAKGKL
jgi:hypothetical protein